MKERELAFDNMCERIKSSHEEHLDFKEGFKLAINELIEAWEDNHRLEERIEKAIEYLEQPPVILVNGEYRNIYAEDDNKLLEILKGE